MPAKPAAPDSTAPIRKPAAEYGPIRKNSATQHDDADDGDRGVLALQVGLRPFLNGGGDLLHPGVARRGAQQRQRLEHAVQHGKHPAPITSKSIELMSSAPLCDCAEGDPAAAGIGGHAGMSRP
jgi:hypothetical protein